MKIKLITIGKTDEDFVKQGFELYKHRINRYILFLTQVIPDLKNTKKLTHDQQKTEEGVRILNALEPGDFFVLLDEKGTEMGSEKFATFLQKRMNSSVKQLVFVIGGPYGFSQDVKNKANASLSLSKMTFSHQLVRVLFAEQLYRAFTILKGEPYHHG